MTDQDLTTSTAEEDMTARQRAIEAYEGARDRASDTLGQAPLLALAGGLAAGALIAALLPRSEAETRAVRPTARRVKKTARAVYEAAKDTGSERLGELGLNRDKAEKTSRGMLDGLADAAKASANAGLEAARDPKRG